MKEGLTIISYLVLKQKYILNLWLCSCFQQIGVSSCVILVLGGLLGCFWVFLKDMQMQTLLEEKDVVLLAYNILSCRSICKGFVLVEAFCTAVCFICTGKK